MERGLEDMSSILKAGFKRPYLENLHRRCNRTSAVYWHRGQDPERLHNPGLCN